jgi:hypothetical protein
LEARAGKQSLALADFGSTFQKGSCELEDVAGHACWKDDGRLPIVGSRPMKTQPGLLVTS